MGIRYQSGEGYSTKLLLRNSVPDPQLIFTLIQEASLLQAREKTQRIRAKHPVYNAVPEAVRGTRRKVADNDLSSDSEDKSPRPRTSTSTRKVIYGL
jgi:hypothetical protein